MSYGEWISVKSKMPIVGERVLVDVLAIMNGETCARVRTTALWTGSQWKMAGLEKSPDEKVNFPIQGQVDYWMPLPDPPHKSLESK